MPKKNTSNEYKSTKEGGTRHATFAIQGTHGPRIYQMDEAVARCYATDFKTSQKAMKKAVGKSLDIPADVEKKLAEDGLVWVKNRDAGYMVEAMYTRFLSEFKKLKQPKPSKKKKTSKAAKATKPSS